MLLGIDWLFIHKTKMDYYEKAIECLNDGGEKRVLQGKNKPTSLRMVIAMQATHNCKKGCVLFAVHISSDKGKEDDVDEELNKYLVL